MATRIGQSVVLGTVLALGLGTSAARAEELAHVNIPFPFVVNGRTLPAGQYDVRTDDSSHSILMIDGVKHTKGHAIVLTNAEYGRDPAGDKPALTFVRGDGKNYRLAEVWESGQLAREVVTTK